MKFQFLTDESQVLEEFINDFSPAGKKTEEELTGEDELWAVVRVTGGLFEGAYAIINNQYAIVEMNGEKLYADSLVWLETKVVNLLQKELLA